MKRLWRIFAVAVVLTAMAGSAAAQAGTSSLEHLRVASAPGVHWTTQTSSGSAEYAVGNVGCEAVNAAGQCTSGVYPHLTGASWIWLPPTRTEEQATFSQTFRIPPQAKEITGVLHVTADNAYRAYLNGELVGSAGSFDPNGPDDATWSTVFTHQVMPIKRNNTLAIQVINYFGPPTDDNPAAVIFRLDVSYVCPGHSCDHSSHS